MQTKPNRCGRSAAEARQSVLSIPSQRAAVVESLAWAVGRRPVPGSQVTHELTALWGTVAHLAMVREEEGKTPIDKKKVFLS